MIRKIKIKSVSAESHSNRQHSFLSTPVFGPSLVPSTKFLSTNTYNMVYEIKVFIASIDVDGNMPLLLQ